MAFTNYGQSFVEWEDSGQGRNPFGTKFILDYKNNVEKLQEARVARTYTPVNWQGVQQRQEEQGWRNLLSGEAPASQPSVAVQPTISQNIQPVAPVNIDYSTLAKAIKADGIGGFDKETAQELLRKSELQNKMSTAASIGSSVLGMLDARQNYVNVKKSKAQYETQKKVIDANVANQEALMMDNYNERMASADALYAARNVDISSGALTGIKQQGAMEMGKDIRSLEAQANINKLALDLDYAIKRRQAKQAEWDAYVTGAFNIGTNIAMFAAGV